MCWCVFALFLPASVQNYTGASRVRSTVAYTGGRWPSTRPGGEDQDEWQTDPNTRLVEALRDQLHESLERQGAARAEASEVQEEAHRRELALTQTIHMLRSELALATEETQQARASLNQSVSSSQTARVEAVSHSAKLVESLKAKLQRAAESHEAAMAEARETLVSKVGECYRTISKWSSFHAAFNFCVC